MNDGWFLSIHKDNRNEGKTDGYRYGIVRFTACLHIMVVVPASTTADKAHACVYPTPTDSFGSETRSWNTFYSLGIAGNNKRWVAPCRKYAWQALPPGRETFLAQGRLSSDAATITFTWFFRSVLHRQTEWLK